MDQVPQERRVREPLRTFPETTTSVEALRMCFRDPFRLCVLTCFFALF